MAKRTDIKKILIIGAGPIVIGQACEFDYSGTQACKALREEGYFVILVNSNPATIMTDESTADRTYIEPITIEFVEKIIAKEQPDAILPTVGGQTALNCALELWKNGTLDKYNVILIGATPDAIDKAENRERFNQAMQEIGLNVAKNVVVNNLQDAIAALDQIGLPAVIRPSFTLGGSGGGIAHSREDFIQIVSYGLSLSPTHEVLIDESLLGWKEYEMEVVRDHNDNAIIICSIENIDPMGVHTGDSITVAPALTLTDKEYQHMRNSAIAVVRAIGVETGGSNVQFAINPKDGRMIVIEMNPRVSRSSALASKATGFPIAKIAAKLAVGYTLDELKNDITKFTPASFEPTIDYIVTKIPRFTFEKFGVDNNNLTTSMKSVGEVMAIGRSFAESLQKALRSLDIGLCGLNAPQNVSESVIPAETGIHIHDSTLHKELLENKINTIQKHLAIATPERILYIAEAFRYDIPMATIHELTRFDPWFLEQIHSIVIEEKVIANAASAINRFNLVRWKKMGFADKRIAQLSGIPEDKILSLRTEYDIRPVYKTIDTCAGEFTSYTPYLYSCYADDGFTRGECEANISANNKVIILGGGPNRIGQGIEFDYACCHVATEMRHFGIETIMVNCNPETVSTDYDTSDKLYFEPLYYEDVIELIYNEARDGNLLGVLVQFGGQTPLKLAHYLELAGIRILGTSLDSIDLAEDRARFKNFLADLAILQPKNAVCYSINDIPKLCREVGYPIILRPSNVLGGRAMAIIRHDLELEQYLIENKDYLLDGAILVDKFLDNAIELDVDAICDGSNVYVAGIMEQIEPAGIHSGDSACILPPRNLSVQIMQQIKQQTTEIALKLKVYGLLNIQYAIKNEQIYVIEVNPRASRTVPFVAKATGVPLIRITAQILLGTHLDTLNLPDVVSSHYAVKEVIFPFVRFNTADILLGPEMKSTGEVMGLDVDPDIAYAKAQIAVHNFVTLIPGDKILILADIDVHNDCKFSQILEMLKQARVACYLNDSMCADFKSADSRKGDDGNGFAKSQLFSQKDSTLHFVSLEEIKNMLGSKEIAFAIILGDVPGSKALRRIIVLNRILYCSTSAAALAYINASSKYLDQQSNIQVNALQDISVLARAKALK